jgi:hypothetical protein
MGKHDVYPPCPKLVGVASQIGVAWTSFLSMVQM